MTGYIRRATIPAFMLVFNVSVLLNSDAAGSAETIFAYQPYNSIDYQEGITEYLNGNRASYLNLITTGVDNGLEIPRVNDAGKPPCTVSAGLTQTERYGALGRNGPCTNIVVVVADVLSGLTSNTCFFERDLHIAGFIRCSAH